jgi:predicted Mrr-cat superfamily restriction endonuclease
LVHTMQAGDLVITPEPATRTVLLGRIAGPYKYLSEPLGEEQQHARTVSWFGRAQRDELSYGARNSLGTLLTLTRPSHERELLRLAETHDSDTPPAPLA